MKPEELRKQKIEELKKELETKQGDLQELEFAIKSAKETDFSKRRNLRRDIAQIKTIINEKNLISEMKKKGNGSKKS